jgi:hypothetical protein
MAKRDCINTMEMGFLAAELKATGDWDAAKARLPNVDPAVLDKGFKAWAFKTVGLDLDKYEATKRSEKAAAEKAAAEAKKAAEKVDPLK